MPTQACSGPLWHSAGLECSSITICHHSHQRLHLAVWQQFVAEVALGLQRQRPRNHGRAHRQGDSSGYLISPCIASFAAVCLLSIHFSACVRLPSTQAKMLSSLSSKQGSALTQRVQLSAARPGTIAVHSSSKSNRMSRKMTAFAYPAVGRVVCGYPRQGNIATSDSGDERRIVKTLLQPLVAM
jgi:hypothetical protein